MSTVNIRPIPAFTDNYIWLLENGTDAILVDPGQAAPCLDELTESGLMLSHILVTHHHPDHIGGIKQLCQAFPNAEVVGFTHSRIKDIDIRVQEPGSIELLGIKFTCLEVPGHTLDHIAYFAEIVGQPCLFSGDTLFSGGCGRLFEGTAEQMFQSLAKIKQLPANTLVYCAHEYTLSNLAFAQSLMPSNSDLKRYSLSCSSLRDQGKPTIPSTLETELKINPFLRESDPEIIDNLRKLDYKDLNRPEHIFAATRQAKDNA